MARRDTLLLHPLICVRCCVSFLNKSMKNAILSLHLSMHCARIIISKKFTPLLMETEEQGAFFFNISSINFIFSATTYSPSKNILNIIGIHIMHFLRKILGKFQNLFDLCLMVYYGQSTRQLMSLHKVWMFHNCPPLLYFLLEGKRCLRSLKIIHLSRLIQSPEGFLPFPKELFSMMLFTSYAVELCKNMVWPGERVILLYKKVEFHWHIRFSWYNSLKIIGGRWQ